jgi:hypothetical protein
VDKTGHESEWLELAEEVLSGMTEWRLQHPRATFSEIEAALDARLNRVRAQLLSKLSTASAAAEWRETPPERRPRCPECGQPLSARGKKVRRLQTQGGQEVVLERTYGVCPSCRTGFFPPG